MTTNLPPEAVEAAARAMHEHMPHSPRTEPWDELLDVGRTYWLRKAGAALSAALPLLTVKPDRDTIARAIAPQSWRVYDADGGREESGGAPGAHWSRERADAVLAVLPGRTEAQVKAEALRSAADVLRAQAAELYQDEHPGVTSYVNCTLMDAQLLDDRADRIERGDS